MTTIHKASTLDSSFGLVIRLGVSAHFHSFPQARPGSGNISGLVVDRGHFFLGDLYLRHFGRRRRFLIHMDWEYAWFAL
jgi:hypothetical protein